MASVLNYSKAILHGEVLSWSSSLKQIGVILSEFVKNTQISCFLTSNMMIKTTLLTVMDSGSLVLMSLTTKHSINRTA